MSIFTNIIVKLFPPKKPIHHSPKSYPPPPLTKPHFRCILDLNEYLTCNLKTRNDENKNF